MIKNKHLLVTIAGFGALTALLSLILIFREKANANRIEVLIGELANARQRQAEGEEALQERIAGLSGELTATQQQLRISERELGQTRKEVEEGRGSLAKLMRKKWLAAEGEGQPWDKEVESLEKRLVLIEGMLKKSQPK